jgi:hypothetical protein
MWFGGGGARRLRRVRKRARAPAATELTPITASKGSCPVTRPGGNVRGAEKGFNLGSRSPAVALWRRGRPPAGPLPDGASYAEIQPDGSIVAKLGWWHEAEGPLTVEGERLDRSAPPLRSDVPAGYGPTGFQPSLVTFPTPGCWKVVGSIGRTTVARGARPW